MNIYRKEKLNPDQTEFDFMAEIREEERKPKAPLQYFPNPKNDNEKMFNLQKEYYEGRDSAFWDMWKLADLIVMRILRNKTKSKKHKYTPEELEDYKFIAVEYVMRRFRYEQGYVVSGNWIVTLECGVQHALDYQTQADKLVEFIDWETLSNYEWNEEE